MPLPHRLPLLRHRTQPPTPFDRHLHHGQPGLREQASRLQPLAGLEVAGDGEEELGEVGGSDLEEGGGGEGGEGEVVVVVAEGGGGVGFGFGAHWGIFGVGGERVEGVFGR